MFPASRLCIGDNGLLVCRLENTALATEKESRLLLYHDVDSDLDNLSCTERLARAYLSSKEPAVPLTADAMHMVDWCIPLTPLLSFLHVVSLSSPHPSSSCFQFLSVKKSTTRQCLASPPRQPGGPCTRIDTRVR